MSLINYEEFWAPELVWDKISHYIWDSQIVQVHQELSKKVPIYQKFKLVFCCNKLPTICPNDPAIWRKIRVIQFV